MRKLYVTAHVYFCRTGKVETNRKKTSVQLNNNFKLYKNILDEMKVQKINYKTKIGVRALYNTKLMTSKSDSITWELLS